MTSEESSWINSIVSGGPDAESAFTRLTQKYGPKLYTQIIRIVKNEAIAKDVLQNVLIKVWKNLSSFKKESNLYTWMYRIAHNESLNQFKSEQKRTYFSMSASMVEILPGHTELDTLSSDEISQYLQEAINTLPKKQAAVFELKYFNELKYNEISSLTGTSEGALKASYHIAREKIIHYLKSKLNH